MRPGGAGGAAGARGAGGLGGGPRRWLLFAGALAVAVLFVGRWAAVETVERAWAGGIAGGAVYLEARNLARLVRSVVLLAAIAWSTLQLYLVYRSIGSVQVPRRVGDLEILEAVPRWVLLGATLGGGVLFGWLLRLGTGDWWLAAALAAHPPEFGATDPLLGRDLGYYLGVLPWSMELQNRALLASVSAVGVVTLLYLAIGALRFQRGRPVAGPHARAHLGTLLSTLAVVLAWGALLDPAEVVAGAHGPLDHAAVTARLPGAAAVIVVAAGVAGVSLAWGWRGQPTVVPAAWGFLLVTQLTVYALAPALARLARGAGGAALPPALAAERVLLGRVAQGLDILQGGALPAFANPAAAIQSLPLWNEARVASVARRSGVFGVRGLAVTAAPHRSSGSTGPTWVAAPGPDPAAWERLTPPPTWAEIHRGPWSRVGAPRLARETDTGLAFSPAPVRDSVTWFGAGFTELAIVSADTWPALRAAGIPLDGRWRRMALALALQRFDLLNGDGALLWRRDAQQRLTRLLPAASFDDAVPLVADSTLWWVSHGYVVSDLFPLVRRAEQRAEPSYQRFGFIGIVNAVTGDTRVYLAPGHDPLSATWAVVFAPLVRPPEELPPSFAAILPFPRRTFELAAAHVVRTRADTVALRSRPDQPFEVPATTWWMAQGFETARPPAFVGLLGGVLRPDGPQLVFWRPDTVVPRPPDLAGSAELKPGALRAWPTAGPVLFAQAQFDEPVARGDASPPPVLRRVYLWWGERAGVGESRQSALLELLARRPNAGPADTTLAGRWREARRLAARADSALARGDLQEFARLYEELRRVLAPPPRFR
ncbi:MAG TPA: UPF0182 family protein [Gemmatimonadales bacterium]